MKTTFLLFLFPLLLIKEYTSCKAPKSTKTRSEYLTTSIWMYDEYYIDGGLAYKRGRLNNTLDLSLNRVKFNADGTVEEISENGEQIPGIWKFANDEKETIVTNYGGVYRSTILRLNTNKFEWRDMATNRLAKMIPFVDSRTAFNHPPQMASHY